MRESWKSVDRRLSAGCGSGAVAAFVLCGAQLELPEECRGISSTSWTLASRSEACGCRTMWPLSGRSLPMLDGGTRRRPARSLKWNVAPSPCKTFTKVLVEFVLSAAARLRACPRRTWSTTSARLMTQPSARTSPPSWRRCSVDAADLLDTQGAVLDSYAEAPGKLGALDGILEDAVGRHGEKVVIWSYYRRLSMRSASGMR